MNRPVARLQAWPTFLRHYATTTIRPPIIRIHNGTFYRHHPSSTHLSPESNPPLFEKLDFELPSFIPNESEEKLQHWAIIGPSNSGKTTFLQVLRGKHVSIPGGARTWPYLESEHTLSNGKEIKPTTPDRAIKQVGFDGEQGLGAQAPKGAYLSARYESRREADDWSLRDYLLGNTELNPQDDLKFSVAGVKLGHLNKVVKDLMLNELMDMPVGNLSNGQTRRARIAKALLGKPKILLLDEPFMGLDPKTLLTLSPLLQKLAEASAPRLVLSLRPQDPIPDWITHLAYLGGNCQIALKGEKEEVLGLLGTYYRAVKDGRTSGDSLLPIDTMDEIGRILTSDGIIESATIKAQHQGLYTESRSRDGYPANDKAFQRNADFSERKTGEALIEMEGVKVNYGEKVVLGNWPSVSGNAKEPKPGLWWTVRRGERWGIFGPNGSGKTTLLSLICSDHPQTYSLPIKLFGKSRIPEPGQLGISIFDLQSRIGHSSPEIHNHIPRSLTVRQVLENAWADTFKGVPKLDEDAHERIDACLRWFEQELRPGAIPIESVNSDAPTTWANDHLFGGLPFSAQRVALFLRAIIKAPDVVILDEAFSGMDENVRDRCMLFLAHGETKQYDHNAAPSTGEGAIHISEPESNHNIIRTPTNKPDTVGVPARQIVTSSISKQGKVRVRGLSEEQALLCISHVKEEVPGSIRRYITLPEAHSGMRPQIGYIDGPVECHPDRWTKIWSLTASKEASQTRQRSTPESREEKRVAKKKAKGPKIWRHDVFYIRRYGKPDLLVRSKTEAAVGKPPVQRIEKPNDLQDGIQKDGDGKSHRK